MQMYARLEDAHEKENREDQTVLLLLLLYSRMLRAAAAEAWLITAYRSRT
jgi:hypothetical protein